VGRLILTTLGPGGERSAGGDEILQIMHRNHIKEMSGHFMERSGTRSSTITPLPMTSSFAEAYSRSSASDGDKDIFYRTLTEARVTRERLRSFERRQIGPLV